MLRPLVAGFGGRRVRAAGEKTLGFPPDVFGVTFNELRILTNLFTEET